jgi:PhnB protein
MLDENTEYQLFAPKEDHPITMWVNVIVPDIQTTYQRAIDAGCSEVQPVVELAGYGVSNASFMDPFGYHWMLHQIQDVVGLEERLHLWKDSEN